jgi:hypothetical protein
MILPLAILIVTGGCSSSTPPESAGAGPIPPEGYKELALEEAMEGLVYEEDRVVIDSLARNETPAWEEDELRSSLDKAWRFLDSGRTLKAIRAFTDAVLIAPHEAEAYEGLGQALIFENRSREALASFLTAVSLQPELVSGHFEVGSTLQRLGRLEEAIESWETVLELDPNHGGAHARLAAGYFLLGDTGQSAEHLGLAQALGAHVPGQLQALLAGGQPIRAAIIPGDPEGRTSVAIGPQVRINVTASSGRANETTSVSGAGSSLEAVAGWNDYRQSGFIRNGIGVTIDGGASWTDQLVRPPVDHRCDVEGDPMTAYDARTGTFWAGGIAFCDGGGPYLARKQAGTDVFDPAVLIYEDGGTDKAWAAAGPRPGVPDSTRLYVAYNFGLQYSDDLGDTWSGIKNLAGGVGFLPRIGPAGELYISYWDGWDGFKMQRSLDGGATISSEITIATFMDSWEVADAIQIPGDFRAPSLGSITVDPNDGTLYAVYHDTTSTVGGEYNVDLYFTHSDDQGASWTTPVVINGDSDPPRDQFFPWLEADSTGRLHLLFLDTRHTVQSDGDAAAFIDAYYAFSDDGGQSWSEHRLTPTSFDSSVTDSGGNQFIGDYMGLGLGGDHVYPVYLSTQDGINQVFSHEILSFGARLFADGFESGGTGIWSLEVQ